jgi:hypothetical protein
MPTSVPTADQLRNECLMRRCDEIRSRLTGLSSLAIIVLAAIVLSTQQRHARADNRAQDGAKAAETPGSGPSRFAEKAVATLQRQPGSGPGRRGGKRAIEIARSPSRQQIVGGPQR